MRRKNITLQNPIARWYRIVRLVSAFAALTLSGISTIRPPSAFLGLLVALCWWAAIATVVLTTLSLATRPVSRIATMVVAASICILLTAQASSRGASVGSARHELETQLRVVSYNVLARGGVPSTTLSTIEHAAADIVLLQEVTPAWERRLRRHITHYDHTWIFAHPGTHGLAILSRFPLGQRTYLRDQRGLPFAQCANVRRAHNQAISVCNVHAASPATILHDLRRFPQNWERNAKVRVRQWRKVKALVDSRKTEISIVAGDFNTLETEPLYGEMTADFADCFRSRTWRLGATFPNLTSIPPIPVARIDYILARGTLGIASARVLNDSGSDHLAVQVEFRL